jgi:hypothetical protein
MSKQFMRLTIDIMYEAQHADEATSYLLQLAECTDEETGWMNSSIELVSANMNRIQLQEVGPSFDLLQPEFCEEHTPTVVRTPADAGECDEPTDGIGDLLVDDNPIDELPE